MHLKSVALHAAAQWLAFAKRGKRSPNVYGTDLAPTARQMPKEYRIFRFVTCPPGISQQRCRTFCGQSGRPRSFLALRKTHHHPRLLRCTPDFRFGSKPEITASHHWHPLHPSEQTLRAQNGSCTATLILWRTLLEMGTKLIFVCQEPKQTRAGCIQPTLDAIPCARRAPRSDTPDR